MEKNLDEIIQEGTERALAKGKRKSPHDAEMAWTDKRGKKGSLRSGSPSTTTEDDVTRNSASKRA